LTNPSPCQADHPVACRRSLRMVRCQPGDRR
jgi:hypothetical protein